MRKYIAASVALFLALLGLSVLASPAQATTECTIEQSGWVTEPLSEDKGWELIDTRTVVDEEAYDEVIVISEAVEGQHYSYTGGPVEGNPDTVPPGDDWQANTHQEPHLNNPNITWVDEFGVGLHYTSQGSSGNADYFYFQPPVDEVTEVVHHDAVTHKEYLFERSICTEEPPKPCQEDDPCWDCETDGNQNCGPDDKPEPKPEPEPTNPQPDKPTLPHTGAGSTALLGLIGTLLISSGAMLYRRFS